MATISDTVASVNTAGVLETPVNTALQSGNQIPGQNTGQTVTQGYTDVVYQETRLYIEGIQVPFLSISVTSGLGSYPQAVIEVAPQSGLMEIAHNYQPKVHIFFIDPITHNECILFNGIISGVSYAKSSQSPGATTISFNCIHRNELLRQITLSYTGYATDNTPSLIAINYENATIKVPQFNTKSSIALALIGLTSVVGGPTEVTLDNVTAELKAQSAGTTVTNKVTPTTIPSALGSYTNRYVGFPGAMLNMWNQLKQAAFQDVLWFEIMNKLYIPLVDTGLKFFQRIGGYYYIENLINSNRVDPCPDKSLLPEAQRSRLVPPCMRMLVKTAVQADVTLQAVNAMSQFSGEMSDFVRIFTDFFGACQYDIVTLTSPARVPIDPVTMDTSSMMALETVVKPQLPFYYSPLSNVYFPNMFSSISINQDEYNIPTRVEITNDIVPGGANLHLHYRAPASIREAITRGIKDYNNSGNPPPTQKIRDSLVSTTMGINDKVGKYEQGRGVMNQSSIAPNWLNLVLTDKTNNPGNSQALNDPQDPDYPLVQLLEAAWQDRYGTTYKVQADGSVTTYVNDVTSLNPWSDSGGLMPYQRIILAEAEFRYTNLVAGSRNGGLTGIFNPYIIPGHSMEIIDPSPTKPSFHAYCIGVTHNITARSIGTTVNFAGAMTYTEVANYFFSYVHPWLISTLSIVSPNMVKQTDGTMAQSTIPGKKYVASIINNPTAKAIADTIYYQTFGTTAVAPDDIYDFDTGLPKPVKRATPGLGVKPQSTTPTTLSGTSPSPSVSPTTTTPPGALPKVALQEGTTASSTGSNGGELNQNLTGTGNLSLVYRPIETRADIETAFNIKFINLTPGNYASGTIQVTPSVLTSGIAMEPGASQFLDYEPLFDYTNANPADPSATPIPTGGVDLSNSSNQKGVFNH